MLLEGQSLLSSGHKQDVRLQGPTEFASICPQPDLKAKQALSEQVCKKEGLTSLCQALCRQLHRDMTQLACLNKTCGDVVDVTPFNMSGLRAKHEIICPECHQATRCRIMLYNDWEGTLLPPASPKRKPVVLFQDFERLHLR